MASTSWSSCSHSSMTCMPPAAQGLPARTAISEYAPGQVEITLQHRFDALQAIDEGVRYKRLVKGVANRHGLQACFMAAVRRSIRQRPAPARQPGRRRWQQSVRQRGPGRDPAAAPGHRWNEGVPAGVFGAVLSERQLVPPLPGEQLRAAGADLGNQQPHRVAAGSRRPAVQPAHRAPHLRRRRQSLPGGGGVARGGAPGYSRATRPRCADHWQRLRSPPRRCRATG